MDLSKWGNSYQKEANNTYFIYPSDEAEFEKLVFINNDNKGLMIRIFTNNEFVYERIVDSKKVEWGNNTNPFAFVRGTSIKRKDIEQIYIKYPQSTTKIDDTKIHQVFKNCEIYAVPKGYEDMLPPKETNTYNKPIQKEDSDQNKGDTMNDKTKIPPLNQILYGPPGTGKTYNTINKALEILGEQIKNKDRAELKAKFDKYRQNGQIEFVTFHQSFSYEEFVEGIKPNVENENADTTYEVKDGIFKDISEKALSNYQAYKDSLQTPPQQQISTRELFQAFAQNLQEQLASAENGIDFNTPSLSTKMCISRIFYFKNEEVKSIAISIPNSNSNQFLKRDIVLRDYEKFKNGEISSYKDIKPTYESLAQWHGNAIYYFALYEKLAEFEKTYNKPQTQSVDKVALKPYILIIDEINRGNISKILGELITLIEPSKRIGADEELRVTLPYSGNEFDNGNGFGVPSNLYIIGTMNTADRSIALLDTALRRRFEFVEMMPQWDNEYISTDCEGVNLQELLKTMNERIEFLLDREHAIGHSFFIGVDSLDKLREVFKLKIIPLLQEYFYDDYAKIQAVLNDNGMIKSFSKQKLEVNLSDDFVDNDKKVYRITDSSMWKKENFQRIYDSSIKIDENE